MIVCLVRTWLHWFLGNGVCDMPTPKSTSREAWKNAPTNVSCNNVPRISLLSFAQIFHSVGCKVFMQNSVPYHTTKSVVQWLCDRGTFLRWLARNSPYFNPIESLWAELNWLKGNQPTPTALGHHPWVMGQFTPPKSKDVLLFCYQEGHVLW